MRIVSRKPLTVFAAKHPQARKPLDDWYFAAKKGLFADLAKLKQTFGSVDYVSVKKQGYYVFDIGGNKYRLVTAIHFNTQIIYVRHVLTHEEYDREDWKKQ